MRPLGIDLAGLADGIAPLTEAPLCPGALLRLTREDVRDYRRNGEVFATSEQNIPPDGMGSMRVRCSASCQQVPQTPSGFREYFGLCASCSQSEADNRSTLRRREGGK